MLQIKRFVLGSILHMHFIALHFEHAGLGSLLRCPTLHLFWVLGARHLLGQHKVEFAWRYFLVCLGSQIYQCSFQLFRHGCLYSSTISQGCVETWRDRFWSCFEGCLSTRANHCLIQIFGLLTRLCLGSFTLPDLLGWSLWPVIELFDKDLGTVNFSPMDERVG